MKEIKIKQLAYYLKEAKKNNQPQPIFFLGAGASVTGNIPLAKKIVEDILSEYKDNPAFEELSEKEKTYSKLMECLSPNQRNDLLKKYIDEAKINVTHIYLAQLLEKGFADYVLTVNFDNLMLRALALYNIFPPTYDMAILKDLTTTTFPEKSVVYLHGQHHGLWLLNTEDEMGKVAKTVPRIFDRISNKRPWIFIGYSGSDPIFEHIKNLGRFDNGLYWIGYNDDDPDKIVEDFLNTPNKNTHYVKGYDADAFMLKLNEELGLEQPQILTKPFSSLKDMLEEVNDINDEDHFKGVKERLEIAKKNVSKAIQQFENVTIDATSENELKVDALKQQIIDMLISEDYDEDIIATIETQAKELNDENLNEQLTGLYFDWGTKLGEIAEKKQGIEKEELSTLAFEKYQKATEINPKDYETYNNWGYFIGELAASKEEPEKEKLHELAIKKLQKAVEINPNYDVAYNNLGMNLGYLAKEKEGIEKEKLYKSAFKKYQKAIEIKSDHHQAFNNWGNNLGSLAKEKQGAEKEKLYELALSKYQKATEIKPNYYQAFYNWGIRLSKFARENQGVEQENLNNLAFEKYQKATEIKPDYYQAFSNWGTLLGNIAKEKEGIEKEKLFTQAFEKYQKAIVIKPDDHSTYNNWGTDLGNLAEERQGVEKEKLYHQAFKKYQKATEIKPDKHETFNNWGTDLIDLAKEKKGIEKEKLHNLAFEKFQKSFEHGGEVYNMACLHAILKHKEEAFHYLDMSLAKDDIEIGFVLEDDDWKHYLEDEGFKAIIKKYTTKK